MFIDKEKYNKCFHGVYSKNLFFTITNYGYILYTLNLLKSLEKFSLDKSILIICFDTKSFLKLSELNYNVFLYKNELGEFCKWKDRDFGFIRYFKLKIMYKILKDNFNFLYTDSDIVFLKDPIDKLLEWEEDVKHDIYIQNDTLNNDSFENLCSGFLYVKSTNDILESFNYKNKSNIKKFLLKEEYENYDQTYINSYIKYKNTIQILPLDNYSNGKYFTSKNKEIIKDEIVLVHMNHFIGNDKLNQFKKYNLWYINKEDEKILKKVIVNHYFDYNTYNLENVYGIGDYIRGCISLYNICKNKNYDFEMDYSSHTISNYLINKNFSNLSIDKSKIKNLYLWKENNIKNLSTIINHINKQDDLFIGITTNLWYIPKIENDCLKFIRESLTPNDLLEKRISETMKKLSIENNKYISLHIRMGDEKLIYKNNMSKKYITIKDKFESYINKNFKDYKVIVFSDDIDIKKYLNENSNFLYLDSKSCHLGMKNNRPEDVIDTLTDFFILGRSGKILLHSELSHGSGFSFWCSKLFNIEIIKL